MLNIKSKVIADDYRYNPYNFIPLGERCIRLPYEKGNLTGSIHCIITPKSDFFIPDSNIENCTWDGIKNVDHKVKEFFSYGEFKEFHNMSQSAGPENPVIPGSELRGMIRNMHEIMTNSCLSAFDDKELSSRLPIAKDAGIIEIDHMGKWKLYKAVKYSVNTDKKYKKSPAFEIKEIDNVKYINGYKTFSKVKFNYEKDNMLFRVTEIGDSCKKEGYLIIGEKKVDEYGNCDKHNEYIFCKKNGFKDTKPEAENIPDKVIKDALTSYNKVIKLYQEFSGDNDCKWYSSSFINDDIIAAKRRENRNLMESVCFPIWYHAVKNSKGFITKIFFSPACIGRNSYDKTLKSYIKDFNSCIGEVNSSGNKCFCESCRLFGLVNKRKINKKKMSVVLPSSIRISDAKFIGNKPIYAHITTLKELSNPKIASMEMYTQLTGIDSDFWTYEYCKKMVPDKRPGKEGRFIPEYVLLKDGDLILNGRKLYYHDITNKNYKEESDKKDKNGIDVEQTERNITIRPLRGIEENKFEFDVYFEHISEEQLKKLLVVLSMRGNQSSYCYKLGTGKPLGLGSVKICVDDVRIRKINSETLDYDYDSCKEKYKDYFEKDMIDIFEIDKTSNQFRMLNELTDLNTFNKEEMSRIGYPIGKDDKGKKGEGYQWFMNNRGPIGNPIFNQVLSAFTNSNFKDNSNNRSKLYNNKK